MPEGGYTDAIKGRVTVDRIKNAIVKVRDDLKQLPMLVIVSEYDRHELVDGLFDGSLTPVAKDDQDKHNQQIGMIDGCMIMAHFNQPRGGFRLVYQKPRETLHIRRDI